MGIRTSIRAYLVAPLIGALVLVPGVPAVASAPAPALVSAAAMPSVVLPSVTRLSGASRIETSVAISQASFSPNVPVAYVATGSNFPDALSGAPVAGMQGGPLLLTEPDALPSVVATELTRLHPGRIVVLGGTGVVSSAVQTALGAYTTGSVTRLSGASRIETSVAISQASFSPNVPVAYVATGSNFPDALSGAPVAGMQGGPLLLTEPDALPSVVATELTRLRPGRIVVLGGTGVVSSAVQTALGAYTTGSVTRLSGASRIETSVAISQASFSPNVPVAYVATGSNFPDALSGAPVAGMQGGPLLLTEPDALPSVVATELTRLRPGRIVVLGGTGVVSDAVKTALAVYVVPAPPGGATSVSLEITSGAQSCVAGALVGGTVAWHTPLVTGIDSVALYQGAALVSATSPATDLAPGTYTAHVTVADGYELSNPGAVDVGSGSYLLDVTVDAYTEACAPAPTPVSLVIGATPQWCVAGALVAGEIGWELDPGIDSVALYQGAALVSATSPATDLAPGTYTAHVTVADGYELSNPGAVDVGSGSYLLDVTVDAYTEACAPAPTPVSLVIAATPQWCVAGALVAGEIGWELDPGINSVALYQDATLISATSPATDLAPGTYTAHVTVADGYELSNPGAVDLGSGSYLLDLDVAAWVGSC